MLGKPLPHLCPGGTPAWEFGRLNGMTRRDWSCAALFGIGTHWASRAFAQSSSPAPAPAVPEVTAYVADFIVNTRLADIPAEVIELARKSILDGIGLALCGSAAQ